MNKTLLCLLIFVALIIPREMRSADFTIGGIWYNVLSLEKHTCEVAEAPNNTTYKGAFVVPSCVVFKDITFTVVGLGKYAFSKSRISSIKLPTSIRKIGNVAFGDCQMLTSISLPDSLEEIGNACFVRCSRLQRINFPKSIKKFGANILEDCTMLQNVTIPEGIEDLNGAFKGCTSLRNVSLPLSLKKTGRSTFYECHALQKVSLPDGVSSIGPDCYGGIRGFSSIIIPSSIDTIMNDAFRGCSNLTSVQFTSSINEIWGYAFAECKMLKKIELPDSLKKLGEFAFDGCQMLNNVIIKDGLESIGNNAFSHCVQLKEIVFPQSLKHIGNSCFYGCNNLRKINIPKELQYIPVCMLVGCHLSKLIIHDGIRKVEMNALDRCDTLIIEDSKNRLDIDNAACSVYSPYLYLGRYLHFTYADPYFRGVKSITFGKSIKSVSYLLSYTQMKNVAEIRCMAETPPTPYDFDNRDFMNITLYIPKGSIEEYKNHAVWGKFLTIKEF